MRPDQIILGAVLLSTAGAAAVLTRGETYESFRERLSEAGYSPKTIRQGECDRGGSVCRFLFTRQNGRGLQVKARVDGSGVLWVSAVKRLTRKEVAAHAAPRA